MTRDTVSPTLALEVLRRDGGCMAPRLGGSAMDCWGRDRIEHVKDELRMGKRAPSDPAHLIWLCAAANLRPPTKEQRVMFREYLAKV